MNKTMLFTVFILMTLGHSFANEIKNYKFKNISIKDGLPSNVITSVIQDRQGFIWISTYNGLVRYDGLNFKHLLNEFDNNNSKSSKIINTIYEDSTGNIWAGTDNNGLYKINPKHFTYVHYYSGQGGKKLSK